MNRINRCFEESLQQGSKPLICFVMAGHPSFGITESVVREIHKAGADIVELGIPFSDPLADGPTIQKAGFDALQNGATVGGVLQCVRNIRRDCDVPLVLMTYFNPIRHYGLEHFAEQAAESGADGVIVTDLPPDEAQEWIELSKQKSLATIFLVAPTSTDARIKLAAGCTTGFLYCVSRLGVTGAQSDLASDLPELISHIKSLTDKPVAVGFGISNAQHVRQVCQYADGAVVGSALVKMISECKSASQAVQDSAVFVAGLKA